MIKEINSLKNPRIKNLFQLKEKSKQRRAQGLFIIEGKREVLLAVNSGYTIKTIYFDPLLFDLQKLKQLENHQIEWVKIDAKIYEKVAYRGSTEGVFAVAQSKNLTLDELKIDSKNPLILVAESPEKPGNIGALLRTADAANVDAVFIADPKTDVYNPNVIRSSVGGLFCTQVVVGSSAELIDYLSAQKIEIYSAILQDSKPYTALNYKKPTALVVGTESDGLTEQWRVAATQCIHIPMLGKVDSMNVSVAAGILMFEAKRQRGFN